MSQPHPIRRIAKLLAPVALALAALPGSTAVALQGHDTAFQLPSGADAALPASRLRLTQLAAKGRAPTLLKALEADLGGPVWATFHAITGVPSSLVLPGTAAPGTVADPAVAQAFAEAFLAKHVELLAPGSAPSDFTLVANELDAGIRTLGFAQTRGGLAVRGGQLSLRFKNDRLVLVASQAIPFDAPPPIAIGPALEGATIEASALSLAAARRGASGLTIATASGDDAFYLPFVENGALEVRLVRSRVIESRGGAGGLRSRLEVFVDATTGAPIASREALRFAQGKLSMRVPDRSPTFGGRSDYPAILANVTVDGAGGVSTATGDVAFAGATGNVVAFAQGTAVGVQNDAGEEVSATYVVPDGGAYVWDLSADEQGDAQLNGFVHAYRVREFAKTFAPTLPFLNQKVQVTVNIEDICNAFSDGTTINFFKSGSGCENTGRIADVIYHEYGHSLHYHAIIPGTGEFEGALSEGISDYLAATLTGDHGTARGFFFSSEPLRDLEPGFDKRWPEDLRGEVHDDGEIIGQTLWDLRVALIAKLGEAEGIQKANELFYQGIRRAVDIPSMYPEILAADDDDGDIENGTPNVCEINAAFGLHGLRSFGVEGAPLSLAPGGVAEYVVTAELVGLFSQCPDDAITGTVLHYENESNPALAGDVPMELVGSTLKASIPAQPTNTTVQYRIEAKLGVDGTASEATLALPDNAADRWYQFYVGEVANIYCTDFEADPVAAGWTHGLAMGTPSDGADDWQWGVPKGTATNGDPAEAFSGKRVWGNDLGSTAKFNGLYQADKTNWSMTPVISTAGFSQVRLQYRRWLNVEDGFFDHATIYANGKQAWRNLNSNKGDDSDVDHRDREWRFHDLDLTSFVAEDAVQLKFELESDAGKELGGWTIDDLCIVGIAAPPDPCANGACGGGGGSGGGSSFDPDQSIQGGCGCAVPGASPDATASIAAILLGLAGVARRRRARR